MKRNLYLLITMSITSIIFLILGFSEKLVFNYKLYTGLSFIILCYFLCFISRKYLNYTLGLILFLGVLNLISFVPFSIVFSIGFIKFELIPLFFLVLFIYNNKSRILDLIISFNSSTEEEKLNESQSKFEKFKIEFKNLSDNELENRLTYDLTPEAKKALLEIKKERKV
nr:hypothetical protein [uncultured Flavobacterium sp.]